MVRLWYTYGIYYIMVTNYIIIQIQGFHTQLTIRCFETSIEQSHLLAIISIQNIDTMFAKR